MFRSTNNIRVTRGLIYDIAISKDKALYTVQKKDLVINDVVYKSLYLAYLDTADPTEYEFANLYFEDYEHWCIVAEINQLKPYIQAWRKELQAKIRSEAYKRITAESYSGRNAFAANKYLVGGDYLDEDTTPAPRGRPKKETEEDLAQVAENEKNVLEDLKRLGILPGSEEQPKEIP